MVQSNFLLSAKDTHRNYTKIIDKGEESVGEVGTDDEIDVIILRMNLLNY